MEAGGRVVSVRSVAGSEEASVAAEGLAAALAVSVAAHFHFGWRVRACPDATCPINLRGMFFHHRQKLVAQTPEDRLVDRSRDRSESG